MTSGFSYLLKQQQVIERKLKINQLKELVDASLLNPQNCSCMLNPTNNITNGFPLTFDGAGIDPDNPNTFASMRLSAFYGGCDASDRPVFPLAKAGETLLDSVPPLVVDKISFDEIRPVDIPENKYEGTITISFASDGQTTPVKPLEIPQKFIATGPLDQLQVSSCQVGPVIDARYSCEDMGGFVYNENTDPPCLPGQMTVDQAIGFCAAFRAEPVLNYTKCRIKLIVPPGLPFPLNFAAGLAAPCDLPIRGPYANEAMNINTQKTLRSIVELLTTPEFSEEFQLQARLAEVFSFESSREVIAGIYQLVGVDAKDSLEIFNFLSGKETLKEDQIAKVMKESQLNRRQSEILIAKVAQSMAGDLR